MLPNEDRRAAVVPADQKPGLKILVNKQEFWDDKDVSNELV